MYFTVHAAGTVLCYHGDVISSNDSLRMDSYQVSYTIFIRAVRFNQLCN